jgi:hypothetical protein
VTMEIREAIAANGSNRHGYRVRERDRYPSRARGSRSPAVQARAVPGLLLPG